MQGRSIRWCILLLLALSEIVNAVGTYGDHYFPTSGRQPTDDNLSRFQREVLHRLPDAIWQPNEPKQYHFGVNQNQVILKLKPTPKAQSIAVFDRYLSNLRVYATQTKYNQKVTTPLEKISHPSLSPASEFSFLPSTEMIYVLATAAHGAPMLVPYQFMTKKQSQSLFAGAKWEYGIFMGLILLSILVSAFFAVTLKQRSLGFLSSMMITFGLYSMGATNLAGLMDPALDHMSSPSVQIGFLTLTAINALYMQNYSQETLMPEPYSPTLKTLFNANMILLLLPFAGYVLIGDERYRLDLFRIIHMPAIVLTFLVCAIASAASHKRHQEQGYLLITWVLFTAGLLIEASFLFGAHNYDIVSQSFLDRLPSLFYTLGIIFVCFWTMTYTNLIHQSRLEAIHKLIIGFTNQNQQLEIRHARVVDLARELCLEIKRPLDSILEQVHSIREPNDVIKAIQQSCLELEEPLHKLTLLGEDIAQHLQTHKTIFDLETLLNKIPVVLQSKAQEHHIKIAVEYEKHLPRRIRGDRSLLFKALLLLLEFRIRPLHNSTVRLIATRLNDPRSPHVQLKISIKDSGSSLDFEKMEQFWTHSAVLGTGDFQCILAQDMIHAMGGSIEQTKNQDHTNEITIIVLVERASPEQELPTTEHLKELTIQPLPSYQGCVALAIQNDLEEELLATLTNLQIKHQLATTIDEAISIALIEPIDFVLISNAVTTNEILVKRFFNIEQIKSIPVIVLPDTGQAWQYNHKHTYFLEREYQANDIISILQKALNRE